MSEYVEDVLLVIGGLCVVGGLALYDYRVGMIVLGLALLAAILMRRRPWVP